MRKTNWDEYYKNPHFFSQFTRKFTEKWLIENIRKYCGSDLKVAEFGGGNSCFHDAIIEQCSISSYTIYDNNKLSVDLFNEKYKKNGKSLGIKCDLLDTDFNEEFDVVFSVGLIEHFDKKGTAIIIRRHFEAVKKGGIIIMTAPTPTFLYRFIRSCAEIFGVWQFHDERPLKQKEILNNIVSLGDILEQKILWATGLTQFGVVVKKY